MQSLVHLLHCFSFSAYCVMLWAAAAANSVSNFTKLMYGGGEDFLRQISHNSIMKKTKLRFFFKWTLSNTLTLTETVSRYMYSDFKPSSSKLRT